MDDLTFLTVLCASDAGGRNLPVPENGLKVWLDASDSTTVTIATGVSEWRDKSLNGNTVVQATGALQPEYVTAVQNNKNIIRFTGTSNQLLAKASPTGVSGLSAATMFVIAARSTTAGSDTIMSVYAPSDGNRSWRLYSPNGSEGRDFGSSADGVNVVVNSVTQGTTNVFALTYITLNGTNVVLTTAGTADSQSQTAFFNSPQDFRVGATGGPSDYWAGDIGEILVYNRLLTAGEITQVVNYLTTKWGL